MVELGIGWLIARSGVSVALAMGWVGCLWFVEA